MGFNSAFKGLMGARRSFARNKAAGTWSWPLASI